jgi:uncharacterized membrane protein
MNFDTSKNLSAVGSLLLVIGFLGALVPYAGILSLIGLILVLIGLKGLANFYNEQGIFNNALYAIIIGVVGAVVAVAAVAISAVAALADLGIDLATMDDWANIGPELSTIFTDITDLSPIFTLLGALLVGVIIIFVVAIIAMYFLRRSMNDLSAKSGVGLFGTAGLLMLIGAVLTIVGIGVFIIWIGLILATVAFFQMRQGQG